MEVGCLHFIAISDFEGEMRKGIGRMEKESEVEDGRGMVAWLQRIGWSNDPARRGFHWSGTPKLVVARSGLRQRGAPMRNTEPLSSFLPVPVELTGNSSYDPSLPLASQQVLRVCKKSVDMLHEFCAQKRPELQRTEAQALAAASTGGIEQAVDAEETAEVAAEGENAAQSSSNEESASSDDSSSDDEEDDTAACVSGKRGRDVAVEDAAEAEQAHERPRRNCMAVARYA
eukprot:6049427-Pleurochrysis_carterae.AAC.1